MSKINVRSFSNENDFVSRLGCNASDSIKNKLNPIMYRVIKII